MAAHVPEYIKSDKLKSSLDDDGEPKKWEYGEIALAEINGVLEKYCFIENLPNSDVKYFIHYSLFIPLIDYKKKNRHEKMNTPEALYLIKLINDIKRNSCCCECGYKEDIQALIFDHVIPAKKSNSISNLSQRYRRARESKRPEIFQKAMEELKKCVIMCANCHSIKTQKYKCGHEKLKTHYVSPEDFLNQKNKPAIPQVTLYANDYEIPDRVLPFPNPNNSQENDIEIHIIDNELCVNI